MLRVEQVCKSYGERQVLRSISLDCAPGAYMLRGPNGVGKSTLLRVLAGVTPPDSGAPSDLVRPTTRSCSRSDCRSQVSIVIVMRRATR